MKKLVSFKISALVIAMFACCMTFSACSDDDDLVGIQAEVVLPSDVDLMELEAWSYVVPFEIKSDSEWRIEKNGDFFDVIPSEGEGNATVEIHVTDNIYEERQNGELRIVFPNDESKNMILNLQQKWEGDYDENDNATATVGTKKYALGYGYNVMNQYANSASVKGQIFRMNELYANGTATCDDSQAHYSMQTITGSTVSEISNQLAANVNVTGKYGKFNGELSSSFTMKHVLNNNYEYAITYFNVETETYSFIDDPYDIASKYMTEAAYNAINGVNENFATTPKGLKNLIDNYGTHVVLESRLGGRIRHSMEINVSDIQTEYDLEAFASAAYDGIFVQASADAEDKFKKSYKDNQSKISTEVEVIGGSDITWNNLFNEFTKKSVDAWKESVIKGENVGLVAFAGNGSLLPLYELVDTKKFPGRKEALRDYIEGEAMAKDFEAYQYQCGTVTKFDIPTFDKKGTLVKDIKLGGEHVGQICEEYIPQINKDSRVIVVYPVINGKMRMNMGFFIGDEYHKPSRVSWNGEKLTIEEYPELDFGNVKTLYLRGASIRATAGENVTIKEGTVKDAYLVGNGIVRDDNTGAIDATPKNYPLVKILNNIWTREDYVSPRDGKGNILSIGYNAHHGDLYWRKGEVYHRSSAASNADYPPYGWTIPSSEVYKSIQEFLNAENTGHYFLEDGLLGYNASFKGWVDMFFWNKEEVVRGGDEQAEYMTSDKHHVRIRKDGSYAVESGLDNNWYMRVRLIKE